jgi:hypothetical protein
VTRAAGPPQILGDQADGEVGQGSDADEHEGRQQQAADPARLWT